MVVTPHSGTSRFALRVPSQSSAFSPAFAHLQLHAQTLVHVFHHEADDVQLLSHSQWPLESHSDQSCPGQVAGLSSAPVSRQPRLPYCCPSLTPRSVAPPASVNTGETPCQGEDPAAETRQCSPRLDTNSMSHSYQEAKVPN